MMRNARFFVVTSVLGVACVGWLATGESKTRLVQRSEASRVTGAQTPVVLPRKICKNHYLQFLCNTANGLSNCGSAGMNCVTCELPGAEQVFKVVFRCEPNDEFSCTQSNIHDEACGVKKAGTCTLYFGNLYFCIPSGASLGPCTNKVAVDCS